MQDAIKRIIRYVSFAIVPIGAALFCIQYFRANDTLSNALVSTVAGVLGMIPEGLVLLTSVSFILGVGSNRGVSPRRCIMFRQNRNDYHRRTDR